MERFWVGKVRGTAVWGLVMRSEIGQSWPGLGDAGDIRWDLGFWASEVMRFGRFGLSPLVGMGILMVWRAGSVFVGRSLF